MRRKATHYEATEGGDPETGSRLVAAGPGMGFLLGNENVLEFVAMWHNLMNTQKTRESYTLNHVSVKNSEVTFSNEATHPAGSNETLYAHQVPLQLRQLLQVLQLDQAVLEHGGHFRDGLEGICVERSLSTSRGKWAGVAGTKPSPDQLVTF